MRAIKSIEKAAITGAENGGVGILVVKGKQEFEEMSPART
jgi:hypothetical protein